MSTFFRIYKNNGDGTASPTNMARCAVSGKIAPCGPAESAKAIPISKIAASNGGNHPIVTPSQSNTAMANNMQNMPATQNSLGAATIKPAETQEGSLIAYRSESFQGNFPFAYRIINLTLTNGGASAVTVPIGDYLGFNADAASLSALPGTLTVSGTFGANTLANIKALSGVAPLSVKGIRFSASVVGFYSSGFVKTSAAQVDGTTQLTDLQAYTWPQSSDFIATIQNRTDLRYMLNPFTAIFVSVPAGQNVTLTLNVASFANVYGMKPSNS